MPAVKSDMALCTCIPANHIPEIQIGVLLHCNNTRWGFYSSIYCKWTL